MSFRTQAMSRLCFSGSLGFSSDVFIMDTIGGGEVSLGDLADLTVSNDNDLSCDVSVGPAFPGILGCP